MGGVSRTKRRINMKWCGFEVTHKQYEICESVWGGENDLACNIEYEWEAMTGKSAWYWSTANDGIIRSSLKGRPSEFLTNGYTSDFEGWGQKMVVKAVRNGLEDSLEILAFLLGELKKGIAKRKKKKKKREQSKRKTRTFVVDVHWDVAKSYEIEAASRKDAEKKMNKIISMGQVCVWTDGFEATDDVEVKCSGTVDKSGNHRYF